MKELARLATESFGIYLKCLLRALKPNADRSANTHPQRLVFCLILFPAFIALQTVHWICLFLDEVAFPHYRKTNLKNPLWITGIPRSGTTFLHRLMAEDRQNFTTLTTWECLLAPSIIEKKVVLSLARIDSLVGHPVKHVIDQIARKYAGQVADIHEISPGAPEEDYLALLPAAGCFFLHLAFPSSHELRNLACLDDLPADRRERLLNFYHLILQKHLFVFGDQGQCLLSKNAAFGSWAPYLAKRYPDAEFIVQIRDPLKALPSQISSIRDALALFGLPYTPGSLLEDFQELFSGDFHSLLDLLGKDNPTRAILIDQNDLKAEPAGIVRTVFNRLNRPITEPVEKYLQSLESTHRSHHHHDFPPDLKIDDCLISKYQQLLAHPQRITR